MLLSTFVLFVFFVLFSFVFFFFTDEEKESHLHPNDRETEGTKNLRKNGTEKKKFQFF